MMNIGGQYRVVIPAHEVVISDDDIARFDEKILNIEVLEKPEFVMAVDGRDEELIPLPEHLKWESWYCVKNLDTGLIHWLHGPSYQISEIIGVDALLAQNEVLKAALLKFAETVALLDEQTHPEIECDAIAHEMRRIANESPSRCLMSVRADAIAGLAFPTMLRKMWSGHEVQEWLTDQASKMLKDGVE